MIRVMLVDDQAIVREGIRSMLGLEPDMTIVGEASNGLEALSVADELMPDVILLDIRMPQMDGLEALRRLKQRQPRISIVMLTLYDDPEYLVQAISAGAAGYILKDAGRSELVHAVRVTADGGAIVDPTMMPELLRRVKAGLDRPIMQRAESPLSQEAQEAARQTARDESGLTARECQVLELLAEGMTNVQIAEVLIIGATTVKTHVQNILSKLQVSDRTQAAVYAVRNGLL